MSVSSHDAFPEIHGKPLKIDAPADDVADPTEELAEEITSELAPSTPRLAEPPPPRTREQNGAPREAAAWVPGNLLRERYVLDRLLGTGGMALVYRAVDLRRDAGAPEGRRVAVKLLRPELRDRPECIARIQREFRQTEAVAHPNVVRVHDLDCDRGAWFIVMEFLSGATLGSRLRRLAPSVLAPSDALAVAAAIGDALVQAHARGIVHGDVKPGNIFLTDSGAPRLLDFGVAPEQPAADDGARTASRPAATRAYASPEILAGEVPLPADDVFSLACVTYEMLAGVHPYRRRSHEVAERTAAAPPPIAALDAAAATALASALDFRRLARPPMVQLVAALRGAAGLPAVTLPPPTASTAPANRQLAVPPAAAEAPEAPRRARALLWSLVVAALTVALAVGILIGRGEPDSAPSSSPAMPQPTAAATPALPETAQAPPPARSEPPAATAGAPPPAAEQPPAQAADAAQPGLVTFDTPMMIVSKRAVVAAIPLRHYSHQRRATQVTWRIVDGSARAGRDYGGPATGVENFVEGNTFRILYVPILPDARTMLDRSFAVELTGASPGTELGPTMRIEVTILGTA